MILFETFTFIEVLFLSLVLILGAIFCSFDRHGEPHFKWVLFCAAIVAGTFIFLPKGTSIIDWYWNLNVIENIGKYLGIGLIYALFVEFPTNIRRTMAKFKEHWNYFLNASDVNEVRDGLANFGLMGKEVPVNEFIKTPNRDIEARFNISQLIDVKHLLFSVFKDRHHHLFRNTSVIEISYDMKTREIQTRIVPLDLSTSLGAWMIFWPGYLLSFMVGDFISGLWNTFVSFIRRMTEGLINRYVKSIFKF